MLVVTDHPGEISHRFHPPVRSAPEPLLGLLFAPAGINVVSESAKCFFEQIGPVDFQIELLLIGRVPRVLQPDVPSFLEQVCILCPEIAAIEIKRNKMISKRRYNVERYFGRSHLYDGTHRARFTTMVKNIWDVMCRQIPFNLFSVSKLMET